MGAIATPSTSGSGAANTPFRPGIRVAVVGAGVSGICAGAHLLRQGAQVTVFERSAVSSGVWHFDPRVTNSPAYPSDTPSVGDYKTSSLGQFIPQPGNPPQKLPTNGHPLDTSNNSDLEVAFAPPGPCYAGLKNNVPTSLLYSSLQAWPPGTEDIISHWGIEKYLQSLSAEKGVDDITLFNTRVEDARKSTDGTKWNLRTITLLRSDGSPRIVERNWEFDAVVVASGHYNLPRVPDLPGLSTWKGLFGDRVIHSKEYRHAEAFRGKNLLLIGGGTSALDICRETDGVVKSVIQSTRGGEFDSPVALIPPSIQRVGAVERFNISPDIDTKSKLDASSPIPGKVLLKSGQVLEGIDNIIVATGYITSYPFLPQFHADNTPLEAVGPEILVTSEGNMLHNLFKDIFYIQDPSLSFIGVPYHNATFSLFDFQAQAVARVLTGKSLLPSLQAMRNEYQDVVAAKGLGRKFHSLAQEGAEIAYVKDLVDLINEGAVDKETELMQGHSIEWLKTHKVVKEKRKQLRELGGV